MPRMEPLINCEPSTITTGLTGPKRCFSTSLTSGRGADRPTIFISPNSTPTAGASDWRFRDALRADPSLVAEYNAWKRQHAVDTDDGPYSDSERPFVLRVLTTRGIGLRPDAQRLSLDAQLRSG